jgi:hypothetical protein
MQDLTEIIRENESLRTENKKLKNSKNNIYTALAKAQGEFETATKNQKNPFFNSKYLTLGGVIDIIRKPFAKNGLSFLQFPTVRTEGNSTTVIIKTIIAHESGETIENELILPVTIGGRISDAQAIGSAITYARRYSLQSLVGISADEEDDDGNSASGRVVEVKSQTKTQVKQQPKTQQEKQESKQHCCKCGQVIENRPLGNTTYFDYSLKELGGYYCKDCGQARKKEMETGQSEMIVA